MKTEKILLVAVNAKYIHSNLAVYSLQAYAKKYGADVDIMEFTINQPVENIIRDIYLKRPYALCLSCYIWNIEYVNRIIREFRKLCPDIPIWLGGPEVSYSAGEYLMRHPEVNGIISGEGEESFYNLCRLLYASDEPMKISVVPGTVVRGQNDEIIVNEPAKPVVMDDIPFCYDSLEKFENRIIYYESSRGCPFSCSYCLSSIDRGLRFRSLELVYKELDFFLKNKVKQVKFVDRTFNCNHEHAMGILKYIKEHDNQITNFHFEISADLLNDDEIEFISSLRPGLIQLEIGVQSTNEVTIREIRRTMKLERLKTVVKRIAVAKNVHQHLDLIAGLPYEDYDTFVKSFDEIYELKPEQLQLGFLKVLSGSHMAEAAQSYGLIYSDAPPYEVMSTRWLSYDKILDIKLAEHMLEIHYNSGQYLRTLAVLERCFDSAFEMFLQLGKYYVEKGYIDSSFTRLRRSEILYEYACIKDASNAALYEQTLIYDIYIREKSKSQPKWIINHAPYAKMLAEKIKASGNEKKYCHAELFTYPVYDIDIKNKMTTESMRSFENVRCVIFDYEKRNPLNNEAAVSVVEI